MILTAFPVLSMSPDRMPSRPSHSNIDGRQKTQVAVTGSTYSFGLKQDIDAISTAIPKFLMSSDRMLQSPTHSDVDRRQKTQMAVG